MIKIIETPRDGMQGLLQPVSTATKVEYINRLLQCGFHTVEVGSFVSPRVIPQMADTGEVLQQLKKEKSNSKIAVLVVNKAGGKRAVSYPQVDHLFYPFSLSPTFLKKNLNTNLAEAEQVIDSLQNLCLGAGKKLVVFLSLVFGDPYGDPWSIENVAGWVEKLVSKGIFTIPLAETIGNIHARKIFEVCSQIVPAFPQVEFGLHTHAMPGKGTDKLDAAYRAGIRRFDTVLGGLGGCPMTGKEMISNLDLHDLIKYCTQKGVNTGLNMEQLHKAERTLSTILLQSSSLP